MGKNNDGRSHPPPAVEVELKLSMEPKGLAALGRDKRLSAWRRGRANTKTLEGTYFDTPDRALQGRGAGLRVRRSADGSVQTLKAGANGLGSRAEWEWPVQGPRPDRSVVEEPGALKLLEGVDFGALESVFVTHVERKAMVLDYRGDDGTTAEVELALDKGEIRAGGRVEPIAEAELELMAGPPSALAMLAHDLRSPRRAMRLGALDKAQRGYLLADGGSPNHVKAKRPKLDDGMTLDDALGAITDACLAHWLANEAAAIDGRDFDGLHQMRVAIRRLRSGLALFKPHLGAPVNDWSRRLGSFVKRTNPPRDLDVLLRQRLLPIEAALPGDEGLTGLRAAAQATSDEARAGLVATLSGQAYADLVLDVAAWSAKRGWREGANAKALDRPVAEVAIKALNKRHKQVKKRGKGFEAASPEERHEVRLALKKLRYACEFLSGLFPGKATKRYTKAAAALQERLGHFNDLTVGAELARKVASGATPDLHEAALRGAGVVQGWNARQARDLEPSTVQAWRKFAALEPFWR